LNEGVLKRHAKRAKIEVMMRTREKIIIAVYRAM